MKLDTNDVIDKLESINNRLGFEHSGIRDAIKVCKIWRSFTVGLPVYFPLRYKEVEEYRKETEERYFPPKVTASYKVKVECPSMDDVRNVVDCIQNTVGVKEVRNVVE